MRQFLRIGFGGDILSKAIRAGELDILTCVVDHIEFHGKAIEWTDNHFGYGFEAGSLDCLGILFLKGARQ